MLSEVLEATAGCSFYQVSDDWKKNRNQSDDWGELDVKLEIEDSRNDFKNFLTDLIRALKLMTLERCSKKGGGGKL